MEHQPFVFAPGPDRGSKQRHHGHERVAAGNPRFRLLKRRAEGPEPSSGGWMVTMSARRVLLVDDEEHIREVAQVSLEMTAGWEVLTAGSGGEGLARASSEQPDAILLDMMMPDMTGRPPFRASRPTSPPGTASAWSGR
jgi:hypothetical protein